MTMTEEPLVASFYALPHDLIMDAIVPNLNFSDITNLISSSSVYGGNKENLYKIALDNDDFLKRYVTKRNMNLIASIHHSSFTLNSFFTMYDNINNDTKVNESIPYLCPNPIGYSGRSSRYEMSEICIDATFELFKILQCLVMYRLKFQFRNFITSRMVKYFKNVFNTRHPNRADTSKEIFFKFISNRDNLMWHISNVNLYYMYENINLIHFAKRSYALKKNIESFDDGAIIINHENHVNTVSLLVNLFTYLPTTEMKMYSFYKIFKYIEIIFKNRVEMELDSNFNLDRFRVVTKEKIEEFKSDIRNEYRSLLPHYLRKMLIDKVKSIEVLIDQ